MRLSQDTGCILSKDKSWVVSKGNRMLCVMKGGSNITMKNVGKTISVFFQRTIAQKVKHLQDNLTHAEVKKRVEIYADV